MHNSEMYLKRLMFVNRVFFVAILHDVTNNVTYVRCSLLSGWYCL